MGQNTKLSLALSRMMQGWWLDIASLNITLLQYYYITNISILFHAN